MDLPDRSLTLIESAYSWLIRKNIPYHSPPTDCGKSAPGLFVFSTCRKWPTLARRGNLPRLSGGAFCLTDRHHFFCLVPSQLPTTHYSAPMSDLGKIFAHFKFNLSRRLLHARIVSCLRNRRQFNDPWGAQRFSIDNQQPNQRTHRLHDLNSQGNGDHFHSLASRLTVPARFTLKGLVLTNFLPRKAARSPSS